MYYWEDEPEAIECIAVYERGHNRNPGPNPMPLASYRPVSVLTLPRTEIAGARFPVIDIDQHLHRIKIEDTPRVTELMDGLNIQAVVNLDGGLTLSCVKRSIDCFDRAFPGRFHTFYTVQTDDIDAPDFESRMRADLIEGKDYGVRGVKLFKDMGLYIRDSRGELILPDDGRLRVIWETAAELGLPVFYHIADPLAFFLPADGSNERAEQLWLHPDWSFCSPEFPSYEALMECQERLLENNPKTTFIMPHGASRVENLSSLAGLLDRFPNCYTDVGGRMADLSRLPYSGRDFLIKYADRVLFGLDGPMTREGYLSYFRALETDDEYFNVKTMSDSMGPGARYMNYGLYLPDDVLKKIYHDNAARLLGLPPLG